MEAASVLIHSRTAPFGLTLTSNQARSLRHFSEHLQNQLPNHYNHSHQKPKPIRTPSNPIFSLKKSRTHFLSPIKCSSSNSTSPDSSQKPLLEPFKNLGFDSIKIALLKLTPFDIIKWSGILSIVIAATNWTVNLVLNPFFCMYFSWTWLFWPWFVAIALAVYGLYCFRKHSISEASIFEQLAIVTSVFTWLTLVPPAHFNGYLEEMV